MQEHYVSLSGLRTKVTTFGTWVEESLEPGQNIVIIIPGNPGVNSFYNCFAEQLHLRLGWPVWIVGHAGHNIPETDIDPLPKESHGYSLDGQIKHKLSFLNTYVPEGAKVHLICHSIGSYMITELLNEPVLTYTVTDLFYLFPTIEYMKETRNGKFLTRFIKPLVPLIIFMAWIFTILPTVIQNLLIIMYLFFTGIPQKNATSVKDLVHPDVLRRVFSMAFEEMDLVRARNDEAIKKNLQKIHFIYGQNDGWAPRQYFERLVQDINGVKAQIHIYEHAFVLRQSIPVALLVCDTILSKEN